MDDWVTLYCTDGSYYRLHYWYCSGYSLRYGKEDDYYSILTEYSAEGKAVRAWKLEYDFDAKYLAWSRGCFGDILFLLRVDDVEMPVVPVKTADTRAVFGYQDPPEIVVPHTGTLLIEAEGEELVLAEQYRPRNSVSYSKHHLLRKGTDGRFALDLDLEDGQFSIFWLQVGDEAYTFQIRVDRSVADRYFTVDEVVQQCAVYSSVYRMEDAPQYCLTPDGQLLEQRPGEDWRSLGQLEEVDLSTQEWDDLFRYNEDGVGWTEGYSVGWFRGFNSHTWLIGEGEGTHYLLQQWDGRFYLLPCVYDEETGDSWARWTLRLTLVD